MLHVDRVLAQSIVDRAMRIVDCNVNIMDARGHIVASGDARRVGALHPGAVLVLAQQGVIEIDDELARRMQGVKPGVNLPLRVEGEIVGCIGLTGDPSKLQRDAELVRLAAETMLEQASLTRLLARDARMREEFVLALARGEEMTPARLEWAHAFGVDPGVARVAAVIEVESAGAARDTVLGELHRLHAILEQPPLENLVATASLTELIVLAKALDAKGRWDAEAHRARLSQLVQRMRGGSPLGLRVALGHYVAGPGGVARSYDAARATLAIGKRRSPGAAALFYEDVRLPVLLAPLRGTWESAELRAILAPLAAQDRRGALLATLQAWFANGMQMGRTAQALGVHRNTLDYRMKRIRDLAGVDLDDMQDCVRLYLAIELPAVGDQVI
jgi:carbohydrate diacid regulator